MNLAEFKLWMYIKGYKVKVIETRLKPTLCVYDGGILVNSNEITESKWLKYRDVLPTIIRFMSANGYIAK